MADIKQICALTAILLVFRTPVRGQTAGEPVTESCLGCVCEAISGCDRTLPCDGDVCGPFRIRPSYWNDAGQATLAPGESPEAAEAYSRCTTDPACSKRTVILYMNKYAQDCNGDGKIDCFDYARIHLRGGYGCARPFDYDFAINYENKFINCYRQFKH